jgi:hypothetical protein
MPENLLTLDARQSEQNVVRHIHSRCRRDCQRLRPIAVQGLRRRLSSRYFSRSCKLGVLQSSPRYQIPQGPTASASVADEVRRQGKGKHLDEAIRARSNMGRFLRGSKVVRRRRMWCTGREDSRIGMLSIVSIETLNWPSFIRLQVIQLYT